MNDQSKNHTNFSKFINFNFLGKELMPSMSEVSTVWKEMEQHQMGLTRRIGTGGADVA